MLHNLLLTFSTHSMNTRCINRGGGGLVYSIELKYTNTTVKNVSRNVDALYHKFKNIWSSLDYVFEMTFIF